MTKASDNEYPSVLLAEQGSDVTTPAAGFWRLYSKATGLFHRDDAGAVTGPILDETAHDALDHTGLTGVGGGGGSGVILQVVRAQSTSDDATTRPPCRTPRYRQPSRPPHLIRSC